jgi:hypothetical protein
MISDRRYLLLLMSMLLTLWSLTSHQISAAPAEVTLPPLPFTTLAISYSGEVYLDLNRNGIREFSEDSIAGVTVTLETLAGEIVEETQTGIDGEYVFANLPEETSFRVRIWPLHSHQTTVNGEFIISTSDPQGLISRSTGLFRGIFLPLVFRS